MDGKKQYREMGDDSRFLYSRAQPGIAPHSSSHWQRTWESNGFDHSVFMPDKKSPEYASHIPGLLQEGSRPLSRVLCRLRGSSHSSRPAIAHWLKQPTRPQRGPRQWGPIWSCSGWSLPCHELLPVARCALTAPFHPYLIPYGPSAVYSLLHWS
jgi:hypothetical protein